MPVTLFCIAGILRQVKADLFSSEYFCFSYYSVICVQFRSDKKPKQNAIYSQQKRNAGSVESMTIMFF